MGGRCRIGRETHPQTGGVHYHAFCIKEKRFVTRDTNKFDVAHHHPNIQPVLRTPEKAWAYAVKDGNVMVDEIPERPVGRSKGNKRSSKDEVWETALFTSTSAPGMINNLMKTDPKGTIRAFGNVERAARYWFPSEHYSEFTAPPGLNYEYGTYAEIPNWQQRYLPQHSATEINTNCASESSASETDSVFSGEGGSVGTSGTAETTLDTLFEPDGELTRYAAPVTPDPLTSLNKHQARPKCLCIIGPSRLGKTLVARSWGVHSYFHGNWSVEQYNPNATYNVFDDIKGQLDGFDFKSFMGGQFDITVTDKYHKKKTVENGKPCVYLSNHDPLTTRRGREHRDWLVANCVFAYVDKPICNIARERLEAEAVENALMRTS